MHSIVHTIIKRKLINKLYCVIKGKKTLKTYSVLLIILTLKTNTLELKENQQINTN